MRLPWATIAGSSGATYVPEKVIRGSGLGLPPAASGQELSSGGSYSYPVFFVTGRALPGLLVTAVGSRWEWRGLVGTQDQ